MYVRIDKRERNKGMMKLFNEQLFCNMFDTLKSIGEEYADLCPIEVWQEAQQALPRFIKSIRPDYTIHILKEELKERYQSFSENGTEIIRNKDEVECSVFLVMMTMMYMLVSGSNSNEENPYNSHCRALADVTKEHPLLERLWQGVRCMENEEEQLGRRVGVMNYLLASDMEDEYKTGMQQIMAEMVNCTLNCSTDTIEKQIAVIAMMNREHEGLFNKHQEVLEQGLKDKNEGKIVREFRIEKADFINASFGSMYDIHGNEHVHAK